MAAVLIKNGRIVTAVDDYQADILIEDGRIQTIGRGLVVGHDVETHDATGLLVLPGGVDVHTHLDWDFGVARTVDTFGTGTKAAAFGGTTTVIDFCNQPRGTSPLVGLEDWHRRAASASVDVGAHMIMLEVNTQSLADMQTLITREGVTSFKLFMAYPGTVMVDDAAIFRAMRLVGEEGGVVALHAENGTVIELLIREAVAKGHTSPRYHSLTRPALMEGEATHRGIRLAELAGAPVYFVHLSAAEALKQIVEARDLGLPVFAETCPHYLFFDDSVYDSDDFSVARYVMTLPLRPKETQAHLWRALKFDDLQVISTDHCPFCMKEGHLGRVNQKPLGRDDFSKIPNGAPGVETRMSAVHQGGVVDKRISLNRFVELVSTSPAKLFGLFPRKGTIAVGSDADIVLFDPNERYTVTAATLHSNCDYTLFEGHALQGRVKKVFLRGKMIVDGERWLGRAGDGRFVSRGGFGG